MTVGSMGGDNIEDDMIPSAVNEAAAAAVDANGGGYDAFLDLINTPSPPSSHQSSDNNNSNTRIADSSDGSPPKKGLLADGPPNTEQQGAILRDVKDRSDGSRLLADEGSQQQHQNTKQHRASRKDSKAKRKAKRKKALRREEGRQVPAIAGMQSHSIEGTNNESGEKQEGDVVDLKVAKAEARAFLAARKAQRERDAILKSAAGYDDESARFYGGDRGPSTRNINATSSDEDKGDDREASGEKKDEETHLVSELKSMKMDNVSGGQQQEDMGGDVGVKDEKAEKRAKRQARRGSLCKSVEAPRMFGYEYEDESGRFFGDDPSKRDLNTIDDDENKGEDRESSSVKEETETHLVSGLKAAEGDSVTGGQQQRVSVEKGKVGGDADSNDAKAETRRKRQPTMESLSKSVTNLVSGLKATKANNVTGGQQGGDVGYKDAKSEARAKRKPRRKGLNKSVEALRYGDEPARFFGGEPSTRNLNDSETDDKDAAKSAEKKDENPTTPKVKRANSMVKYSRIKQFFKEYRRRR